jgi:rSAM/selenodomain-associated transferase 1
VPGQAKTRLIPRLGAEGAARLHAALIRRALRSALDAKLGPVSLWCAPDTAHPVFAACARELDVALRAQRGSDLGERMNGAFAELCRERSVLLIGSDCPALGVAELREAASALRDGNDAVFVPAEDGGYVLVGLARPIAAPFAGIAWGSDAVMTETRRRLAAEGLRWRELGTSWDVDRPEDYARLQASGLMTAAELPPALP